MPILHPIFAIIFIFLAIGSFMEVYTTKKKLPFFLIIGGVMMILTVGLRANAGADFPIYRNMFPQFGLFFDYEDILPKALFQETKLEIEWIYALINKIIFGYGFPFFMVTLVTAIIAISIKLFVIYKNVPFPILAALFYFLPLMFFDDAGQMRQGLGVAICLLSFQFIKSRNLVMFLLCMYIALGFHKTAIAFIPAYWLVKIPMNSVRIFWIIILAILASPLELYRLGGEIFSSIAPPDASNAYMGYVDDRYYGTEVESGLNDIIKFFWIIILIIFDKKGCERVWWYEYMRNLGVFGLVLFYIFRGNQIFAIRLPVTYMFFLSVFCLPSLLYALRDNTKQVMYAGLMTYLTLMFFHFGSGNGHILNFSSGRYKNILFTNE